tara:strand:+ start:137 stop:421 length:285 start_codon:yes stop_codon:yes gene_type:complete
MATNNIDKQSFGQNGILFRNTDVVANGDFCALQLVADTKFEAITYNECDTSTGNALHHGTEGSAYEFPTGTIIYGQITSFKLHAGAVIAYKACG